MPRSLCSEAIFILWFAFLPEASRLINNETDISYGTYLYAWPIQNALIYTGHPNPLIILPLALIGATICEYLSWLLIERTFLRKKPRIIDQV